MKTHRSITPPARPRVSGQPRPLRILPTLFAALLVCLLLAGCGEAPQPSGPGSPATLGTKRDPYWYLSAVQFTDGRRGCAVGGTGGVLNRTGVTYLTRDGGDTWVCVSTTPWALRDVEYPEKGWAFSVGALGTVMRWHGRRQWEVLDTDTNTALYSLDFLDRRRGVVVGDELIMTTTNGGRSWRQFTEGLDGLRLYGVELGDELHGWAVGATASTHGNWGGTVLRTTDGGKTWTPCPVPTNEALYAVDARGPDEVWIVGNHGLILYSDDGGDSWITQRDSDDGTPGFLRTVELIDGLHGWAAGSTGKYSRVPVLLETDDGGGTWRAVDVDLHTFLTDVTTRGLSRAWVVGNHYSSARTTDGKRWRAQQVAPPPSRSGVGGADILSRALQAFR